MASFIKAVELKLASFPESYQKSKIISIEQPLSLHSDLFIMSLLINTLKLNKNIAFYAFRQNFAHYSSLAKRLGVSLQQYISNGQLIYIQSFFTNWNYDLPMTEISPATYSTPSSKVIHLTNQNTIMSTIKKQDFSKINSVFIDSINFLKSNSQIVYQLYQNCVQNNIQIIMGGQRQGSPLSTIFGKQADIKIVLQQNVGGFGRLKLQINQTQHRLLWKANQGKFEISNSVTI